MAKNKWDEEPSSLYSVYSGVEFVILRHPRMKHLCGYIGFPEGSSFFDRAFNDMPFDVHGGFTYSGRSLPNNYANGKWWLGFDAAHAGDLIPYYAEAIKNYETFFKTALEYRDFDFIEGEIKRVIDQYKNSKFC